MPTPSFNERRNRILALEDARDLKGLSPAEASNLLLVAAVHIATQHAREPVAVVVEEMAEMLGDAIVEAAALFDVRH